MIILHLFRDIVVVLLMIVMVTVLIIPCAYLAIRYNHAWYGRNQYETHLPVWAKRFAYMIDRVGYFLDHWGRN